MSQPRTQEDWIAQFKQDVADNQVFIYSKGGKNAAMCGFSHRVMELFNQLGVDYRVRDIFSDPMIKPALVAFTDWPTTPQIFIGGNFIGDCDIATEMYENGELQKLLDQAKP